VCEDSDVAQPSSTHERFNTAIAATALLVSGASAFFTWTSNQAKRDALSTVVRPVDCRTEYHGGTESGDIGLCWGVTLANDSENRLSIVDARVLDIQSGRTVLIGGFQNFEAGGGVPLGLPIILDGGEAKEIFVRGAVMVPPAVARVISQMPEYQNHTLDKIPLASVQRALAMANLDFLGNRVEPTIINGKYSGFSISPPVKGVVDVLTLTTGRGATFSVRMTYPPEFDRQPARGRH
jgi:hypothetical protein